jgi:anti-sigma regulatory factor (Ser/Thr protein kinase)
MKKRTESDWTRQRNASYRNHRSIYRPKYYRSPFFINSILGTYTVSTPSELTSFSEQGRSDLYTLLRQINEIPERSKMVIDFRSLSKFKISAVLVLFAHLEILIESRPRTRILWHPPQDSITNEKLASLGFWEMMGGDYKAEMDSIKICSVSHQQKENDDKRPLKEAIRYAEKAIASYGVEDSNGETDQALFAAVSESFSNVWQHAYTENINKKHSTLCVALKAQKWWIALQHLDGQLFIAVYDVGVGIPASTRKKEWYTSLAGEILSVLGGLSPDSRDIQTALEYGSSRFNVQGRGNGLPAVKRFVEINPNGQLQIMSGKSLYIFRSKDNFTKWTDLVDCFPGTLIQWNIALGDANGEVDED